MTYDQENGHGPAPSERERELRPEGDYKVKCVAHKFGRAGTGTEQIGIRLAVVEGPHKGTHFIYYGFFTDNTIEHTIKAMRALGFTGDDVRDVRSMYTSEAIAVVAHEADRDGKVRERVRWINGADVVMNDVMSPQELSGFAQRMRGAFARFPGGGGVAQPPPQQGQQRSAAPPPQQQGRQQHAPPPRQQQFGTPPPSDMPWGDDVPPPSSAPPGRRY